MRLFGRKKKHDVAVSDLTDVSDSGKPIFLAVCGCGWYGDQYATSDEAFREANEHAAKASEGLGTVAEEIIKPDK